MCPYESQLFKEYLLFKKKQKSIFTQCTHTIKIPKCLNKLYRKVSIEEVSNKKNYDQTMVTQLIFKSKT